MREMHLDASESAGLAEALAMYGEPARRLSRFSMGPEFMDYWHHVLTNRDAEVVLAIQSADGRFLVHTKREYPQGLYRLCSGGVKRGEDVVHAVRREMLEETGLDGEIVRFLGLLRSRFCGAGEVLSFTSYLFHIRVQDARPSPEDEDEGIIGYRFLDLKELSTLSRRLRRYPDGFWRDWGRFRAVAHRVTIQVLGNGNG